MIVFDHSRLVTNFFYRVSSSLMVPILLKMGKSCVLIGYMSGQYGPICPHGFVRFDPAQEKNYVEQTYRSKSVRDRNHVIQ